MMLQEQKDRLVSKLDQLIEREEAGLSPRMRAAGGAYYGMFAKPTVVIVPGNAELPEFACILLSGVCEANIFATCFGNVESVWICEIASPRFIIEASDENQLRNQYLKLRGREGFITLNSQTLMSRDEAYVFLVKAMEDAFSQSNINQAANSAIGPLQLSPTVYGSEG